MNRKIYYSLFFLIGLLLISSLPAIAAGMYNIKHDSEYVWDVTEEVGAEPLSYRLTARFNLQQNRVNITAYFYGNGSEYHYNLQMTEFKKYIIPNNEKHGHHNYFYTGAGSLKFPRHVITIEEPNITQVIDSKTGITLYYVADTQTHVLTAGEIPISLFVWIILGLTLSISCFSIIFILKRGKKEHHAIVY
jgi:hypothetical protein